MLTFPRTDIITAGRFATQEFLPVSRQETSRTANGRTIVKSLGSALWSATYSSMELSHDEALILEAQLNSLDGALQAFEAYDLRRPRPLKHGAATQNVSAGDGVINFLNANNKALSVAGIYASQTISVGDYLSFDYGTSRALHQAVETAVADITGTTPQFEVRPHIRAGATTGVSIKLFSARGRFTLVPGSVTSKTVNALQSVVSFQAVQVL